MRIIMRWLINYNNGYLSKVLTRSMIVSRVAIGLRVWDKVAGYGIVYRSLMVAHSNILIHVHWLFFAKFFRGTVH